ncbi:MAG: hypothetical protein ACRYFK_08795 [Janthinobacterium lividum]
MQTLPTFFRTLLVLAIALAFRPALAQHGLTASPLTAMSPMPTPHPHPATRLNEVPVPETDARFYDDTHKDLGPSLVWMQEANATQPTYWNLYTEARIHLKMSDYPAALATAVRARTLAQNACNDTYAHLSEEVIKLTLPALPSLTNTPLGSTK